MPSAEAGRRAPAAAGGSPAGARALFGRENTEPLERVPAPAQRRGGGDRDQRGAVGAPEQVLLGLRQLPARERAAHEGNDRLLVETAHSWRVLMIA